MNYWNLHKEFRSLGCTNEAQTTAACQLYIELCELRKKANVKYFYNADLDFVYLTISNAVGYIECFYLASLSSATIDLTATEIIRTKLIDAHAHECNQPDTIQLILAIVDPNTTIVYYKLSIGLVTVDSLKEQRLSVETTASKQNELNENENMFDMI